MSKTITLTDEQYKALQSGESITIEPPNKQWQPRGGMWWIDAEGSVVNGNSFAATRLFGIEFNTKKEAEYASEQYRIYHWMFKAWLEVVGDWRPDWDNEGQCKHYAYYNHSRENIGTTDHRSVREAHGFLFPTKGKAQDWADMVGHLIKKLGV